MIRLLLSLAIGRELVYPEAAAESVRLSIEEYGELYGASR